eukprot:g11006.t1
MADSSAGEVLDAFGHDNVKRAVPSVEAPAAEVTAPEVPAVYDISADAATKLNDVVGKAQGMLSTEAPSKETLAIEASAVETPPAEIEDIASPIGLSLAAFEADEPQEETWLPSVSNMVSNLVATVGGAIEEFADASEMTMPKMETPTAEVNAPEVPAVGEVATNVGAKVDKVVAEVPGMPFAEVQVLAVDAPAVGADVFVPDMSASAPVVPEVPSADMEVTVVDATVPAVEAPTVETPEVGAEVEVEAVVMGLDVPSSELPAVDVSVPAVEAEAPVADVPAVDGSAPSVDAEVSVHEVRTDVPAPGVPAVEMVPVAHVAAPAAGDLAVKDWRALRRRGVQGAMEVLSIASSLICAGVKMRNAYRCWKQRHGDSQTATEDRPNFEINVDLGGGEDECGNLRGAILAVGVELAMKAQKRWFESKTRRGRTITGLSKDFEAHRTERLKLESSLSKARMVLTELTATDGVNFQLLDDAKSSCWEILSLEARDETLDVHFMAGFIAIASSSTKHAQELPARAKDFLSRGTFRNVLDSFDTF